MARRAATMPHSHGKIGSCRIHRKKAPYGCFFSVAWGTMYSPMPASQHRVLATQGRRPLPVAGPTRAAGWPGRKGCRLRQGEAELLKTGRP